MHIGTTWQLYVAMMSQSSTSDGDAACSQNIWDILLFSLDNMNQLQFHNLLSVKHGE